MSEAKPKTRGRPRAFDPDKALHEAREVFWDAGYAASSLDELSTAMAMNRPSVYAAFGDKEALYLKTLEGYRDDGAAAIRAALDDAGLAPSAIGYVNLHATATRKNDEMESHLMARVFADGVAASGTKPYTGHQLGAAGATELGFAWLTLAREHMALPRHCWDGQADPALPRLDLVESERYLPRGAGTRYVMSNSFAFGGSNCSLILAG